MKRSACSKHTTKRSTSGRIVGDCAPTLVELKWGCERIYDNRNCEHQLALVNVAVAGIALASIARESIACAGIALASIAVASIALASIAFACVACAGIALASIGVLPAACVLAIACQRHLVFLCCLRRHWLILCDPNSAHVRTSH